MIKIRYRTALNFTQFHCESYFINELSHAVINRKKRELMLWSELPVSHKEQDTYSNTASRWQINIINIYINKYKLKLG